MSEVDSELITLKEFEEVGDFETPIQNCKEIECYALAELFSAEANKNIKQGENSAYRVYNLLYELTSISFDPTKQNETERFGPLLRSNGNSTPIPSDYQGNQTEVLIQLVPDIKNLVLRARLADIIWQNDRSQHEMAQNAIDAYVEAVDQVLKGEVDHSISGQYSVGRIGCFYLMRALQISKVSKKKGWDSTKQKKLINEFADYVRTNKNSNAILMILRLSLDYNIIEPAKIAESAENIIISDGLDIIWQRDLWKMAAKAYLKCNNSEKQNRCLTEAAECCVIMAENCGGKGLNATAHLNDAIKELRKLPGTQQRRSQLKEILREAQTTINDESAIITRSIKIDISDFEEFRKKFQGLNLCEKLICFAGLYESPCINSLNEVVNKQVNKTPLLADMPWQVIDDEGHTVSRSTGLSIDGNNTDHIRHMLINNENARWSLSGNIIELVRHLILTKHRIYEDHFRILVEYVCFIPENRKEIVATGLMRYFCGDFVSALHILVPQLENSLRHILNLAGDDTSKINQDMTQEMRSLSMMLNTNGEYRNKLEELLGEAIIFEIDNLFNHRAGPSLRHKLLHGLCTDDDFKGCMVSYACWFIFRFCYLGLRKNTHNFSSKLSSST